MKRCFKSVRRFVLVNDSQECDPEALKSALIRCLSKLITGQCLHDCTSVSFLYRARFTERISEKGLVFQAIENTFKYGRRIETNLVLLNVTMATNIDN